jgi:glycosyl transferase, family 25
LADHLFAGFDQVRIINLVDRPDRRREMERQLARAEALDPNVGFFEAHRPESAGEFPSLGARGCFESHLALLRQARAAGVQSLLLLEDDFDLTRGGRDRAPRLLKQLSEVDWDIFYGAHLLPSNGRVDVAPVPSAEAVLTASFVAFSGRVLPALVNFLEAMQGRPAGSPEYGPMHVDGAYTVFRELNPQYQTFAAFPPLGKQRRSRSDITPSAMFLDRWPAGRRVAELLRGAYNRLERR